MKNLFTGSNRFEFKSPILNGKTDTFETLESSLSIKIKNEFPDEKRGSRFSPRVKNSNFSHMGLASNENVEGIQSERKISKSSRKSESTNNEYYKKALMNSTLPKSKKSVFREEIKEIEMKSKN